jgi:diamine N-acetyltransferase
VSILQAQFRSATPEDAVTVAALAVQVFLDTYATEGVRPDLAREAFAEYSVEAFTKRLQEPDCRFFLAEHGTGLIGFAEIQILPLSPPAGAGVGANLVRLYVQPRAQRQGVGGKLLRLAELAAADAALRNVWLTAWEGNLPAHSFYAAHGYQDIGATTYTFEGHSYVNRVFTKPLRAGTGAA